MAVHLHVRPPLLAVTGCRTGLSWSISRPPGRCRL